LGPSCVEPSQGAASAAVQVMELQQQLAEEREKTAELQRQLDALQASS
jgi:hypothetical protein